MSKHTSSSSSSGGLGFVGALALLFIALKLMHVIDWPWVWVLAPIWISVASMLTVLLVVGVVALAVWFAEGKD